MTSSRAHKHLAFAIAAVAGCGGGGGKSAIDAPPGSGDAALVDAAPGSCVGPGYGTAQTPASIPITSVDATIHDLSNAPLAGVITYVSGLDLASAPGMTDSAGHVTQTGNGLSYELPAFKFGDAVNEPELFIPLTTATTTLGTLQTGTFPTAGATMTAGGSATSNGVTLTFAANADIEVDEIVYGTADQQKFRAIELPLADEATIVATAPSDTQLLFGIAPADTTICPPAQLSVPNSEAWPANTAVEFYVSGDDTAQSWAPFAGWGKLSDGAVTADGMSIVTSAGGGVAILGTIAITLKP